MKTFLQKYSGVLWILGAAALTVFVMWHMHQLGYTSAENKYKALMAEADEAHAEVYAQLEADARKREQDHAADLAAIDQKYSKELKNVQAKNKADMAALRNGNLRLRDRFICPDTGGRRGAAGTGSIMDHGTGIRGLRLEDAEFLVSESDRADEVVVQLQACQDIVRADRNLSRER